MKIWASKVLGILRYLVLEISGINELMGRGKDNMSREDTHAATQRPLRGDRWK